MVTTVKVHEVNTHLSKLLKRVINGEQIVVAEAESQLRFYRLLTISLPSECPVMMPGKSQLHPTLMHPYQSLTYKSPLGHSFFPLVEYE
jgi:hypothetical protein